MDLPSRYSKRVQKKSHIQGATSKSAKVSSLCWDTSALGPLFWSYKMFSWEKSIALGKTIPPHTSGTNSCSLAATQPLTHQKE